MFWLLLCRDVLPACTMALICSSSRLLRAVMLGCSELGRLLDVGLLLEDAPLSRPLELRREPCGEQPGSSRSSCTTGRMQANMAPDGAFARVPTPAQLEARQ